MSEAVQIEGLKDLNKALKRLERGVASKISRSGTTKIAQVIRKEMRRRAPVASGVTKKSLVYKTKRLGRTGFAAKVGPIKKRTYIARFLEYGTAPHRIPSLMVGRRKTRRRNTAVSAFGGAVYSHIEHPGIRAQPFLRPAFEAVKEKAVRESAKKMWTLIEKATRK